jgi:hypothetical protein
MTKAPPGGLTATSPGQTDRVKAIVKRTNATKPVTNEAEAITAEGARALTDRIRGCVEQTWELVIRAYRERADVALGYESWDAYTAAEFNTARLRLPLEERQEVVGSLRDAGLSIRAIAAATGLGRGTVQREIASVPNGTAGGELATEPSDDGETEPEPVDEQPIAPVIGLDGKRHPANKPPAEPVDETADTTPDVIVALTEARTDLEAECANNPGYAAALAVETIRADAANLAGEMGALAPSLESLFTRAAGAGIADEIEALFVEPLQRLCDTAEGTNTAIAEGDDR